MKSGLLDKKQETICGPGFRGFFFGKNAITGVCITLIFRRKINDFSDFSSNRLSVVKIFFVLANNRFFSDISTEKSDFLFPGYD